MPEPLYRSRPSAFEIRPASAPEAGVVHPGIWVSPGLSNTYLLTTDDGRVVVNTGMGFEAPVHRANFDAIDASPVRYIVLTQGHYDHVGGADVLRDEGTEVIAQANWELWRDDNERLERFRSSNAAFAWIDAIMAALDYTRERGGGADAPVQARPQPTIVFDDRYEFALGGRRFELYATPGGETTDSLIVWLPDEGVCLCGNVFGALFGHIPNLVTMRGDRYRDAHTFVASLETVRRLQPETLLTGHFDPIRGRALIDDELTRLRDAVLYVHDRTVEGMNEGADVQTLMREITLPRELDVGEGYGKISWDVRAIWENYAGWFHHRSTTELYPFDMAPVQSDLVELAGGPDAVIDRARARAAAGEPVVAVALAEAVLASTPNHAGAREVMVMAHEALLATSVNFWETAWLRRQVAKMSR